jgi:hypothetical protein
MKPINVKEKLSQELRTNHRQYSLFPMLQPAKVFYCKHPEIQQVWKARPGLCNFEIRETIVNPMCIRYKPTVPAF